MVGTLLFNAVSGSSSPLFFGFVNTLQIINYFPFLGIPIYELYLEFVISVSNSNLDILNVLRGYGVPGTSWVYEYQARLWNLVIGQNKFNS